MGEKNEKSGVAVVVNSNGVEARVSEGTLTKLGTGADWLFPRKAARAKITAALAESVAEKIRSGIPLGQQEQYLVSLIFEKEARALANRQAATDRFVEVYPEVEAQTKSLPEQKDRGTSPDFIARAESVASDLNDTTLRDLFARVLAGEVSRPGSYSMKTLELIRTLDSDIARLFDYIRQFVFNGDFVFSGDGLNEYLDKREVSHVAWTELNDAGLVSIGDTWESLERNRAAIWTYGDGRQLRAEGAKGDKYAITRLTRAGRQIASVLPPPIQDDSYFLEVGAFFANELLRYRGTVAWRRDQASEEWHLIMPT